MHVLYSVVNQFFCYSSRQWKPRKCYTLFAFVQQECCKCWLWAGMRVPAESLLKLGSNKSSKRSLYPCVNVLVSFEHVQSLLLLWLADALPINMPSAEGTYAMCGRNILNNELVAGRIWMSTNHDSHKCVNHPAAECDQCVVPVDIKTSLLSKGIASHCVQTLRGRCCAVKFFSKLIQFFLGTLIL